MKLEPLNRHGAASGGVVAQAVAHRHPPEVGPNPAALPLWRALGTALGEGDVRKARALWAGLRVAAAKAIARDTFVAEQWADLDAWLAAGDTASALAHHAVLSSYLGESAVLQ